MSGPLSLVLDLSASLYMGLVDASGRVLAARVRENARGESAHALLDEILAEAGAAPADLGDIAVGAGPGSFTGIRVGVALAQGLAFAGSIPLYPFSTLAAALACAPAGSVAAVAANAGRWYVAHGTPPVEALRGLPDLLALAPGAARLVTNGPVPDRDRLAAAFPSLLRLEEAMDFGAALALARSRPPVRDGVVRPNYLMASAAEEKRKTGEGPSADGAGPAPGGAA